MTYKHQYISGQHLDYPTGKAVCIGRNYMAHIKELNNTVPSEPLLFMKPSTSFTPLSEGIQLPKHGKECHHELEVAVLIGEDLKNADKESALKSIVGYGLALDLTLRDVQTVLKEKGQPWELAKGFDGACPLSPFIDSREIIDPNNLQLSLHVNDQLRQQGNTQQMLLPIVDLLVHISQYFTLQAGDVVLTGTPEGVGLLQTGDKLTLNFDEQHTFTSYVD